MRSRQRLLKWGGLSMAVSEALIGVAFIGDYVHVTSLVSVKSLVISDSDRAIAISEELISEDTVLER